MGGAVPKMKMKKESHPKGSGLWTAYFVLGAGRAQSVLMCLHFYPREASLVTLTPFLLSMEQMDEELYIH